MFTLDLSDNIIDKPLDLADELVSKKIKVPRHHSLIKYSGTTPER